jgi:hypothetical protein
MRVNHHGADIAAGLGVVPCITTMCDCHTYLPTFLYGFDITLTSPSSAVEDNRRLDTSMVGQ